MAQKRKANDAFGKPGGQLSAVAAARLLRQSKVQPDENDLSAVSEPTAAATAVAATPYDGHHSDALPSGLDSDVAEFVSAVPKLPPTVRLSKMSGSVDDNGETIQLNMRTNDYIPIVGEYDIEVTKGLITIYGAAINSTTGIKRVFAPSTHAIPQIIARKDNIIVNIKTVKSSLVKLENLSPLFRNIWAKDSSSNRSFAVLNKTNDDELKRSLSVLEVDDTLQNLLARISKRMDSDISKPRIMAIGPKSAGKSTLNRLICNTVLNKTPQRRCFYLDLDPGQPEFGPPGQISLVEVQTPILGPPFTHPATPASTSFRLLKSHSIAGTSFKDDPEHYIACAGDLLRSIDGSYPVVVNSCGWVTGLGSSVHSRLATELRLTDLVVMSPVEEDLVSSLQTSQSTCILHRLPRRPTRPSARTPAEARSMQYMAYFHQKTSKTTDESKWTGRSIDNFRPWSVSYAAVNAGISAIVSYGQSPDPEFLGEIIDGSLVSIVSMDAESFDSYIKSNWSDDSNSQNLRYTPEGLPHVRPNMEGFCKPLAAETSECIGLALVRGIDTEQKTLHLVTPLNQSQIEELNEKKIVLVRGSFDAPEWAYLESLYSSDNELRTADRPWVSKKEMVGVEGAVWRLRHPPMAGQITH